MVENYSNYKYTKKEWLAYFFQGALIGGMIGYLCYSGLLGTVLPMSYGLWYVHNQRKHLTEERRWQLNLQFKDGLASVSAALNAGYSVENALAEAVKDLKLMYSPKAFIICEFEGIVRQINMNRTVEEVLKEFADRSGIDDIKNFAEVLITAKRTGGDLIKIIRSTGNVIGDKIEVKREILTLITAKKFEYRIMNVIPFCIIAYLRLFSPGFLNPLYGNPFGILFMSFILIVYCVVGRMAKNIISIEV